MTLRFDNNYSDENAAGIANAHASIGPVRQNIRKLSGMFDNLKQLFSEDAAQNNEAPTNIAAAAPAPRAVPEGRFTGCKTVRIGGVGALTIAVSCDFRTRTMCTFKVKCYAPETLDREVSTLAESNALVHKCGSYPRYAFRVIAGDIVTLPGLQNNKNQGKMEMGCRLHGMQWNEAQQQVVVDVKNTYAEARKANVNIAPELLSEIFSEPIVLNAGTCEEIERFNNWTTQTNENARHFRKTERNQP